MGRTIVRADNKTKAKEVFKNTKLGSRMVITKVTKNPRLNHTYKVWWRLPRR